MCMRDTCISFRIHNSNDGKSGDLGWVCIPLVVETYSMWGQEAVKSFAQLASRLAITCSKPKSVITHGLCGRLNTCLVQSVASAILSRIEHPLPLNCPLLLACYIVVCMYTIIICFIHLKNRIIYFLKIRGDPGFWIKGAGGGGGEEAKVVSFL